jgi:DNA polymerase III delta prime subunit
MLGPAAESAVLGLNAFDARGIDVVRNKIKISVRQEEGDPARGQAQDHHPGEADSVTDAAQQALRHTMKI